MITKEDLLKVFDYTTTGVHFLTHTSIEEIQYDIGKSIEIVTVDCKLIRDFINVDTSSISKNPYKAIQDNNVHFTINYYPYTDNIICDVILDEEIISTYDNNMEYFKEAENMFASKIRNLSPRLIYNPIISYEDDLRSEHYSFDVVLSDEEEDIFRQAAKEFIGEDLIREYLRVDQEVKLLYKKIEFVKKRI